MTLSLELIDKFLYTVSSMIFMWLFSLAWSETQLKKNWFVTKLHEQQNSSFGLVKFIWLCWLERECFASSINRTWIWKSQALFLPWEQNNQGWKNLQNLNNPVKTIKMRTYANRGREMPHQCERSHIIYFNWAPSP